LRWQRVREDATAKRPQSDGNAKKERKENNSKESKRRVFKPPTPEEVIEYCKERGNKVDPQRWLNHYESNGFMVGKNKMKDWKAAVRKWENSDFNPKAKNLHVDYKDSSGWNQ